METSALLLLILGLVSPGWSSVRLPTSIRNHLISKGLESKLGFQGERLNKPTQPHEFKFQVSIGRFGRNHVCSGAIINPSYILTSAICCRSLGSVANIRVYIGEHDLASDSDGQILQMVSQMTSHPDFDDYSLDNDICTLKLASPLSIDGSLTAKIDLISTSVSSEEAAFQLGWKGGEGVLQKEGFTLISDAECEALYESSLNQKMLCGMSEDSWIDDAGGPLVCKDGKYHCGIASWGASSADNSFPYVFTETSEYLDWISNNS